MKKEKVRLTLRLKKELLTMIRNYSEEENRSINSAVEVLLQLGLSCSISRKPMSYDDLVGTSKFIQNK